ncbi:MAG TPA: hypothetical protein VN380_12895 [Thermoanaerobaculia bacterium]|jgi:hypothetical protein|nr:hypothetical protein [Thermoanaerobaculia bacterium]
MSDEVIGSNFREELLLEEYRSLRGQLDYQIRDNRELERNAVIGVAAVFAWLASIAPTPIVLPAWLLPPVIAYLARLRSRGITGRIDQIAEYLRALEQGCNADGGLSPKWETIVAECRQRRTGPGLASSHRLFWRVLLTFSASGALYGFVVQFLPILQKIIRS